MKKLFLVLLVLVSNLMLFAESPWPCSGDSDCPEGMKCDANSCAIIKEKVAEYAAIRLTTGENNPNSFGSNAIFVTNPANDLVLGQLAVNAYAGDGDGKFYFIQEISTDISVYPSSIKFENLKLVYDANGNAVSDSSEKVVAEGEAEGSSIKFKIHQQDMAFKMNQAENFLIVGSFSSENPINDAFSKFNATIRNKTYIVAKGSKGEFPVEEIQPINFPSFSFEPSSGYFLFASGRYFPQRVLPWQEINKEQEIMHLRLKAIDDANELTSLKVNLYGTSVSFGNGVRKISLCTDKNNDGKCDEVIAEVSDFIEPQQDAVFQIPSGRVSLNKGDETFLVIKADLNFYKGQNTYFYIAESDITLKTRKSIAVTQIKTNNFNYNCSEDTPECQLKPEENQEESDDSGCSVLFID